ncbi:MAG TPA: hypothetical protein VFB89_14480 [Gemmatimonadales bacterium]|nr:hypothetical protein [Gemmatimonadales bacterium]
MSTAFSTHDQTTTSGALLTLAEGWADVKTPGWAPPGPVPVWRDGRTYAVGTIDVQTTDSSNNPMFSGYAVRSVDHPATTWPVWTMPGTGNSRQIVIVQCSNPDQSVAWQNFFYGDSGLYPFIQWWYRAINARAISVWPAATEADTRVAICGETYDSVMPRNQFPGLLGWTRTFATIGGMGALTFGMPSGFIAVYDGSGVLLCPTSSSSVKRTASVRSPTSASESKRLRAGCAMSSLTAASPRLASGASP